MEAADSREVGVPFMEALEPEEAKALREVGGVRSFDAGKALFHENQVPESVMVIERGRIKFISVTSEGKEVVLAVREKGDLIGEQSTFDGAPRSATAIAIDPVEALVVPAETFRRFLEQHPRVALVLLEMLSRRLRDSDSKRIEYSAHDAVGRVAARLIELVERFGLEEGDGVRIDLPLTQEDLAGWTGVSLESVGKATQTMRKLGWIETGRRRITVLDLDAMRQRANS